MISTILFLTFMVTVATALIELVLSIAVGRITATGPTGDRRRYLTLTFRRTAALVTIAILLVQVGLLAVTFHPNRAWFSLAIAGLWVATEVLSRRRDDDWFRGRVTKIWDGLRHRTASAARDRA